MKIKTFRGRKKINIKIKIAYREVSYLEYPFGKRSKLQEKIPTCSQTHCWVFPARTTGSRSGRLLQSTGRLVWRLVCFDPVNNRRIPFALLQPYKIPAYLTGKRGLIKEKKPYPEGKGTTKKRRRAAKFPIRHLLSLQRLRGNHD